jgi:site-specific DNA-methyltransferase (cytosine-N4-specific)
MTEIETLEQIDWDFAEASTNSATNTIHPYPAKFIPQIPRHFIQQLSSEGDTVYEPFLGSGTTAVEANIIGRNAIGNDVNELAVLISKVKTTPLSNKQLLSLDSLLNKIYNSIDLIYSVNKSGIAKPDILNLDLWFEEFVIYELVIIKEEIEKLSNKDLIDFCLVALSGIIINVSHQDSDTRYVRVTKNIAHFDTFDKFAKQLNKLRKIMSVSCKLIENGKSVFKVADSRQENIFRENSANLAVTSPPYPNAYDYHLYHKYRLFWLGMNPHDLRKSEIGAHADYSKKNGPDEFDFMRDMEKCFLNTSNILKQGSYFVLVIGDSILKGRNIRNNEILKQAAENTPFNFVTEFTRNLKLSKKSFNPKIGNIKTEKIVIFENLK